MDGEALIDAIVRITTTPVELTAPLPLLTILLFFFGVNDSLLLVEVLLAGLRVRFDGVHARLPVSGAYLAMFLDKLKGLHQAQDLFHIASHGKIIDGDLTNHALGVDDEQASAFDACRGLVKGQNSKKSSPVGDPRVLLQHPVVLRDLVISVR